MYFALLLATTLGAGLILHALASCISLVLWRSVHTKLDQMLPRIASRFLFALRMSPLVLSAIILTAFVIPSFLEYEPSNNVEPVSSTLLALACVFVVVLSGSVARSVNALIQSTRVMREWSRKALRESADVHGVEVYKCDVAAPVIAVMGLFRTRIFASNAVIAALTPAELQAALLHEAVHVRRFDVLKKMFLQLAPAFLPGIDILKPIAAHWSRMCELSADEESVAGCNRRSLDLAAALVKVARLANPNATPELPTLSAALAQKNESLIGFRVKRLLHISEHPEVLTSAVRFDLRKATFVVAAVVGIVIAAYPQALDFTHELLEFLVQG